MNDKKTKKIIFKIPQFPQISETFIIAQIKTAIDLGYDVQIITRKYILNNIDLIDNHNLIDKIIVEDYKIPKNKFIRLLKWVGLLILNVRDIHFVFSFYKEHKKFSLTWLYHWVFYKQFNKANVFHVQYGTNSKPLPTLKKTKFFKPKIIVTFHGHDAFFPLYGYIENNGYYKDLFNCDAVITANTPYLYKKIEVLGCPRDKLKIIPVGVKTSYFYPQQRKKANDESIKLITVGRLDKVKGHRYCIEVVQELLKLGVECKLTIIGEGKERTNLEALINKYNLITNIQLLGSKNPNEIREAFWEHDLYLLLAIPVENNRRETQGLATLEAQACGLPAIVFDSGGVKYTVQDGVSGFICKEFDIEEVVSKVKYLSKNRKTLAEMGKNAVKFVNEKYSQNIIDDKWKHLYHQNK